MVRVLCIISLSILLAAPLAAQEARKKSGGEAAAEKNEGRLPSGHLAVEVVLKNEAVFHGVALKGRMVEKCVRHQYRALLDEERGDFGAGIRVWYYDDLLGFLFIPYRQIAEVKVGDELNRDQLETLKAKVEERRLAKEAARQKTAGEGAPPKSETPTPATDPADSALLAKFPPSEGFSPERYAEIQRASVTGDAEVSARDKAWVEVFPDWLKAYRATTAPKPAPEVARKDAPNPAPATKKEAGPQPKSDGVHIGVKVPKAEGSSGSGPEKGIR